MCLRAACQSTSRELAAAAGEYTLEFLLTWASVAAAKPVMVPKLRAW